MTQIQKRRPGRDSSNDDDEGGLSRIDKKAAKDTVKNIDKILKEKERKDKEARERQRERERYSGGCGCGGW